MSSMEISRVLSQIRALSAEASGSAAANKEPSGRQDFAGLLVDSVNKVNESQQQAGELATRFEVGDPSVNLAQVMVALQKSSLSFQALTQVRNKLVSAYQEIMNMQV